MSTTDIRYQLHHFINSISDQRITELYAQLESEMQDDRTNLIAEERSRYMAGEGKSYSWEEVKNMALNKEMRNGI